MVPLHPFMAHIPLVLSLFMPVIMSLLVFFIYKKNLSRYAWWGATLLQVLIIIFCYLALSTGESEEEIVEQFVPIQYINKHENMAEVYTGLSVIVMGVMMIANYVKYNIALKIKILAILLSFLPIGMGLYVGQLGGEIAYVWGGADAYAAMGDDDYTETEPQGILPTPGMNTSESEFPLNELDNPDADFEEYEKEQGGDPASDQALPEEDESFSKDEENSSY